MTTTSNIIPLYPNTDILPDGKRLLIQVIIKQQRKQLKKVFHGKAPYAIHQASTEFKTMTSILNDDQIKLYKQMWLAADIKDSRIEEQALRQG